MPYEISLQELLKTRDEKLYGRLLQIGDIARSLLSYTQGKFPYYTPHDFHHSITVEENINWIMPDTLKEDLNTYEIFLLIVATWLHDWGMIGREEEDPLVIRETHHIRTEEYFEKLYEKISLNSHEALIAGRIAKGHRRVNLYSTEYDDMILGQGIRIRTRLLSAVLRIADEMDVTHSRTPEVIYYSINPSDKSEEEFKKHLSITGIGQLDAPHKVYLTGIARDPMGAKAIRELQSKIQTELNAVKSILSQYGIQLDIVELRLETRGFVDKPIGFEIDKGQIVDLLIGTHLYGNPDVAIRELVQNAVDSCNVRKRNETGYTPKIFIEKKPETIIIEDNGMGMGFLEAKRFLSRIGCSFYKSEDFKEIIKNKVYDPISNFGIGLLSSFLIADRLTIETKKAGEDACLFTISALDQEWKYEKSGLNNPGTRVVLYLNQLGKRINLKESLYRYFICLDIPVTFRDGDADIETLPNIWSCDEIVSRFFEEEDFDSSKPIKTVTQIFSADYDVILAYTSGYFRNSVVLFNHGIYVNKLRIDVMDYEYCIFVNIKRNLIDLHISREDIIENSKWFNLMHEIFNAILKDFHKDKDIVKSIRLINGLIEKRILIDPLPEADLLIKFPLLYSFFELAPFPTLIKNSIEYYSLEQILNNEEIIVYRCASRDFLKEIDLLKNNTSSNNIVFQPYSLPDVGEIDDRLDFIQYLVKSRGKSYQEKDLRTLLLDAAKEDKTDYSGIAPSNVRFATFGDFKPLVVVLEHATVAEHKPYFGHAYWGNILLFWDLLDEDRRESYKQILQGTHDEIFESIELIAQPVVLLDSSDDFIRKILNNHQTFTTPQKQLINKYFKYLAFLPMVIGELYSCIIFIETIDSLEQQIAAILSTDRPNSFFTRLKPNAELYIDYFNRFGMTYITK